LAKEFDDCYAIAREKATEETTIFLENFSEQYPYAIVDVLSPDFLPS
jgi:Domain of unknown function DUF29